MAPIECIRKTAEHIRLVSATIEHAQLLFDIFTGTNTQKYSPVAKTSVPELSERLKQAGRTFSEQAPFYRFFGEYNATLFGTFTVKNIQWENGEAEIGFSLLDQWQGQGLGSALVYKCVTKVFAESYIQQIWATVSNTNEPCQRLMRSLQFENCGFYKETFMVNGELTPQILYRMNRKQVHCLLP